MKGKKCRPRKDTIGPLAVDTMIQEHQDAGTLEPISQRTQTILCILRKADIVFPTPTMYLDSIQIPIIYQLHDIKAGTYHHK